MPILILLFVMLLLLLLLHRPLRYRRLLHARCFRFCCRRARASRARRLARFPPLGVAQPPPQLLLHRLVRKCLRPIFAPSQRLPQQVHIDTARRLPVRQASHVSQQEPRVAEGVDVDLGERCV